MYQTTHEGRQSHKLVYILFLMINLFVNVHPLFFNQTSTFSLCLLFQKSAVYSCMVHGRVANEVKSVYVEVVNRSTVPMCHEERMFGILWPETAPDLDAVQDCPVKYVGTARRRCNLRNTYFTQWDLPDFSSCISEAVENIHNNVSDLTMLPV